MKDFGNENGNGFALSSLARPKKSATPPVEPAPKTSIAAQVTARTVGGVSLSGLPLRVTREGLVFELYHPEIVPQLSETFEPLKLTLREQTLYSGRAIVRNVINAGVKLICEVTLNEGAWLTDGAGPEALNPGSLDSQFSSFIHEWRKFYHINNEYKLAVTDAQNLLQDLNLWLNGIDSAIRIVATKDRAKFETEIALNLRAQVTSALKSVFEKFEIVARTIEPDAQALHKAFAQRALHPFLLCSPLINRTYSKPLGYAGDYEMMNMLVRNGLEGNSLFAKLVNSFLLDQPPAHAVRNRVNYLHRSIIQETTRVAHQGGTANVFCVACGPAWEASNFIEKHPLADKARFVLLDFNEETLQHTTNKITEIRRRNHRKTSVTFVKNSVQNLIKAGARGTNKPPEYDLVYCSGLYDYLNDAVCKSLNNYLYELLKPGGLLVVGNFAPSTPIQNFMEHLLEWHLIYRDYHQVAALVPERANPEDCFVRSEPSGTNFFLEVRKPDA